KIPPHLQIPLGRGILIPGRSAQKRIKFDPWEVVCSMLLGLGIDTGGTFTDGVIYDFDEGKVIQRAKRQTTPFRLSDGIEALMEALDETKLKQLKLVALSTTLATNACVENRGSRVALFLLGYDPNLVDRLKGEYGLEAAQHIIVSPGAH